MEPCWSDRSIFGTKYQRPTTQISPQPTTEAQTTWHSSRNDTSTLEALIDRLTGSGELWNTQYSQGDNPLINCDELDEATNKATKEHTLKHSNKIADRAQGEVENRRMHDKYGTITESIGLHRRPQTIASDEIFGATG